MAECRAVRRPPTRSGQTGRPPWSPFLSSRGQVVGPHSWPFLPADGDLVRSQGECPERGAEGASSWHGVYPERHLSAALLCHPESLSQQGESTRFHLPRKSWLRAGLGYLCEEGWGVPGCPSPPQRGQWRKRASWTGAGSPISACSWKLHWHGRAASAMSCPLPLSCLFPTCSGGPASSPHHTFKHGWGSREDCRHLLAKGSYLGLHLVYVLCARPL